MIRCKTADCDIICLKKKGRPCDEQVAARAPEAVRRFPVIVAV